MTASEREASVAPRKVWSSEEIGLGLSIPKALLDSVAVGEGFSFGVFGLDVFGFGFGFGFEVESAAVVVVVVVVLMT